jgi:hypothetical protein
LITDEFARAEGFTQVTRTGDEAVVNMRRLAATLDKNPLKRLPFSKRTVDANRLIQFSFFSGQTKLFTKLVNLRAPRDRTLTESSITQPVPIGIYIAQVRGGSRNAQREIIFDSSIFGRQFSGRR